MIGSHSKSSLSLRPTLPSPEPHERKRVSWLFYLGWNFAYFSTRFLGCLALFSNSHFSILSSPWVGLHSHGPASCLATTRTIWSEWTRAWWPAFPAWSSREPSDLGGLNQRDPLGFEQYVPWVHSTVGSPINPGHPLFKYPRKTVQLCICTDSSLYYVSYSCWFICCNPFRINYVWLYHRHWALSWYRKCIPGISIL
jgi:hypothetical protein